MERSPPAWINPKVDCRVFRERLDFLSSKQFSGMMFPKQAFEVWPTMNLMRFCLTGTSWNSLCRVAHCVQIPSARIPQAMLRFQAWVPWMSGRGAFYWPWAGEWFQQAKAFLTLPVLLGTWLNGGVQAFCFCRTVW